MRRRFAKLLIKVAARLLAGDGDTTRSDTTRSDTTRSDTTKSGAATTTTTAALDDIAVSAVLWGLPAKDADKLAGVLLTRGIGPHTARRLFYVASERVQ